MGISTASDIVPFVVHYAWCAKGFAELNEVTQALMADEDLIMEGKTAVVRGWKTVGMEDIGKRERIYCASRIESSDEKYTVWLHNESEYSMIGYYDVAIIADNRESIDAFISCFKDTFKDHARLVIEEQDTVTITC